MYINKEERFETVRFSADWLAGGLRTGDIAIAINVGLCACCPSESYPAGLFHGKQAASLYEGLVPDTTALIARIKS